MPERLLSSFSESSSNTNPVSRIFTNNSSYARDTSISSLNNSSNVSSFKNSYSHSSNTAEHALLNRLSTKSIVPKINYEFCKKVRVSMALLGILLLVAAIFMLSFYLPKQYENVTKKDETNKKDFVWDKNIYIKDMILSLANNFSKLEYDNQHNFALNVFFGELLSDAAKQNSTLIKKERFIEMTFYDDELITFTITKQNFSEQCYEIHWKANYHTKLQDCFDVKNSHWFGLGELFSQKWPLNKVTFPMTPFLTSDFLDKYQPKLFGGVLEPLIVNSLGGGIYVADYVPLHVSMNDNTLSRFCIKADYNNYHMAYTDSLSNELNYTICFADNIKNVHKLLFDQFINKPDGVPDREMFTKPIWSTWVRYQKNINGVKLKEFVNEIKAHNFEGSQIEIDDQYSSAYGDYDFDTKKFSDINKIMEQIKEAGFRVTVWVYPFSNIGSKSLNHYKDFVVVGEKGIPGLTEWWDGIGAIIDTTSESARQNFINRLLDFKKLGIDGFKFDAGEVNYLPYMYKLNTPQVNPNYFSYNYVKIASAISGNLSEVRVGYKSQRFSVFVRILDRSTIWEVHNGLRSVLTAVLTLGILGYPFILPDMVGGNTCNYKPDCNYKYKLNRELYVRWTQLSIFLPAIQFSVTPWDYDNDVVTLVQNALMIRKYLSDEIYKAACEAKSTGNPIIRPLWWYWPYDKEAIITDSQFMLGENFLITPVLDQNVVLHQVYLPVGIWEKQWGEKTMFNITKGSFQNFNVTLSDICYFKLVKT
ncbi:myogenesis-regulating glycosidase [Hydra vulgaris]|uniref:Myogenesis-regulating glycosidase n=1 Tax=Hydra vulgaris TaxID=6087 RepID=A0ABM4DD07_HYDVU